MGIYELSLSFTFSLPDLASRVGLATPQEVRGSTCVGSGFMSCLVRLFTIQSLPNSLLYAALVNVLNFINFLTRTLFVLVPKLEVALGIPKKKKYPRATLVRKFILVQESEIVYPSLN